MAFIQPAAEQIKRLIEQGHDGPVVMVNLLKFKPDGGKEKYQQYYEGTMDLVLGKNISRRVYRGEGLQPIIGDEEWDEVALYEYPSLSAFLEMARNTEYQEVAKLRTESLLDSRLFCTIEKK